MKRHSLHIGIDRYEDEAIRNAMFGTADATMLAALFGQLKGFGIVKSLANPSCKELSQAFGDALSDLSAGDLFAITFSGHCVTPRGKSPLFLCVDDHRADIEADRGGFALKPLVSRAAASRLHLVLLLDACMDEDAMDGLASQPMGGASVSIVAPSKAFEVPDLGHGLFSAALNRAVAGIVKNAEASAMATVVKSANMAMKEICAEYGLLDLWPAARVRLSSGASGAGVDLWDSPGDKQGRGRRGPASLAVRLVSVPDDRRLDVMRAIREATGLSLADVKAICDRRGVVRSGLDEKEAQALARRLRGAGAILNLHKESGR